MKPLTLTVRAIYGRHVPVQEPSLDEKTKSSQHIFERRRLDTHATEEDDDNNNNNDPITRAAKGPDRAYFEPGQGLVGHDMYHTEYQYRSFCYEERAVLLQSIETYLSLTKDEKIGQYFHMYHADTEEESKIKILEQPNFGEQLIVEGCDASQLCIGDVFEVSSDGGESSLKLEITSPRLPCNYVDRKFESPFGSKGVKRRTLDLAAAGWFCRVLEKGEVSVFMCLLLVIVCLFVCCCCCCCCVCVCVCVCVSLCPDVPRFSGVGFHSPTVLSTRTARRTF